jgi:hypothetical protein
MKIYLDDMRKAPPGWKLLLNVQDVLAELQKGNVTYLSLDHDLGDDETGTGYDVILWIEKEVFLNGFVPPEIKIHTANVSARKKMELGLQKILEQTDTSRRTL